MNKQEYIDNIIDDCRDFMEENVDENSGWQSTWDEMLLQVTGNDNGSYYCNSIRAEKSLEGVMWDPEVIDLVKDLCPEGLPLDDGPEACDVIVRYVLMENMYDEIHSMFKDIQYDMMEDED